MLCFFVTARLDYFMQLEGVDCGLRSIRNNLVVLKINPSSSLRAGSRRAAVEFVLKHEVSTEA